MNNSILDAANLAWKMGLVAQNKAKIEALLPTYSSERRSSAVRVIETSGRYLRFVCGSKIAVPNLRDPESIVEHVESKPVNGVHNTDESDTKLDMTQEESLSFITGFLKENGQLLVGLDCPYDESVVSPRRGIASSNLPSPVHIKHGVRAPNPRICLSAEETGYLYDKLSGPPRFHLVLFLSSFNGQEVRRQASCFTQGLSQFYTRFGGPQRFNVIVVVKCLPFEMEQRKQSLDLEPLWQIATMIYDDRAPDEDAHTTYGINHYTGGVAVIRPDLWVGMTAYPCETEKITSYFGRFLIPEQPANHQRDKAVKAGIIEEF